MNFKSMMRVTAPAPFAVSTAISVLAFAGEGHGPSAAGQAGKTANVTRTINVVMYDNYYEPEDISVKDEAAEAARGGELEAEALGCRSLARQGDAA